jgi:hypothetical protein
MDEILSGEVFQELTLMAKTDLNAGISIASNAVMGIAGAMGGMPKNTSTPATLQSNKRVTQQGNQQNAMDSERGIYDQMYRKPTSQQYFQNNGQDANINTNYYLQSLIG